MEKTKKQIGIKIKETLDNSEIWITRSELAKKTGLSEQTIYNVLNGKASVDSIIKVALVLKIDIFSFLKPDKSHSLED